MEDGSAQTDIELYLLRHAHAGNPAEWTGDDAKRPLSKKGRRQAEMLGQFMAQRGFAPDSIVTSSK
ncbi:MAG TPA: histidine phosphatase family protein, partial [Candidatus Limnocylindrales bacterium]|nr:histidine phosphatase family protein [Candidatus Limnocylindrales bacterium]